MSKLRHILLIRVYHCCHVVPFLQVVSIACFPKSAAPLPPSQSLSRDVVV